LKSDPESSDGTQGIMSDAQIQRIVAQKIQKFEQLIRGHEKILLAIGNL